MVLKIGNAQGFWGDMDNAAKQLVSLVDDLDYLTLDYMSEIATSIMAIQKQKDPSLGYAKDFINVVRSLIPYWKQGHRVKVITNGGGLNAKALAKQCYSLLEKEGVKKKVAVILGDNVLEVIREDDQNPLFNHLDTGDPIIKVKEKITTATAYIGAKPIVQALEKGADIVISGRVSDPSLTVGPCVYHHRWSFDDYDKIAQATVAGHLIECGTQVTGGIWSDWMKIDNKVNIGFPLIEMDKTGDFVLTKPQKTGGVVNQWTVKEQLLYEISDPNNYLSPDVTLSLLSVKIKEQEKDRVFIQGAQGKAATTTYKVSVTYKDGYKAENMLVIVGERAIKKAKMCGEVIIKRVLAEGFSFDDYVIEALGSGDATLGVLEKKDDLKECVLRVAVKAKEKEAVQRFVKEIAPMVTSGPQGVTGYTTARAKVRDVFGFWPCLIEKCLVPMQVEIL